MERKRCARKGPGLLLALSVLWVPAAVLNAAPSQPAPSAQTPARRDTILSVARSVISAARFATFVTIGPTGEPQARIVDPLSPDPDMSVFVATNPRSRKVSEIRRNPRVTLLYFDAVRLAYVTLVGRAFEVKVGDKATHHKQDWQPFFPLERPESYLLYRIEVTRVELVSAKDGLSGDPSTWRPEIVTLK